jgi:hypothetical protein
VAPGVSFLWLAIRMWRFLVARNLLIHSIGRAPRVIRGNLTKFEKCCFMLLKNNLFNS